MIKRYIKRPIPIEAIQWDGTNAKELKEFSHAIYFVHHEDEDGHIYTDLKITTWEGTLRAEVGDYIIKGIKGEVYPCNKDIFESSYEEVKNV